MMNVRLIEDAVRMVANLFEAEGIYEQTSAIRERATEWYLKIKPVDPEMLAAATITGSYKVGTSWSELLEWKEFYFPSTPIDETLAIIGGFRLEDEVFDDYEAMIELHNFHIGDIEMSLRDATWR